MINSEKEQVRIVMAKEAAKRKAATMLRLNTWEMVVLVTDQALKRHETKPNETDAYFLEALAELNPNLVKVA